MKSQAATVAEYLASLPADRRAEIEAVRKVILANLDGGFEEGMQYGMIGYYVPHSRYPAGYHCDPKQPLPFAGLASQKSQMSLYMMCLYADSPLLKRFVEGFKKAGKKLDMGKACVRFKTADALAMDVIAETLRAMPATKWIEVYEKSFVDRSRKPATSAGKPKSKTKPAAKKIVKAVKPSRSRK